MVCAPLMTVKLSLRLGIFSSNTSPTLCEPLNVATPEIVIAGPFPVSGLASCRSLRYGRTKPQFVQDGGRKSGEQLRARDVGAILKIGSRVERVDAADGGVERIFVAEIIVADEELVLLVDLPIGAEVDELRVLHRWARSPSRLAGNADRRRIGRIDRVGLRADRASRCS